MALQLGAKDPSREIELGKTGSWIFVIIFLTLMGIGAFYLVDKFLINSEEGLIFIKCNDDTTEKLVEGKFTYCGEYVGADTKEGIKQYMEEQNRQIDYDKFITLEE